MAVMPAAFAMTLKLRPTCAQAATFNRWLWHLTAVHNWTLKAIKREGNKSWFPTKVDLKKRLNGHSVKMGIPVEVIRSCVDTAHESWRRHSLGLSGKPKFKSSRRRMSSIGFADGIETIKNGRVSVPGVGRVRFFRQSIPIGKCGFARVVRRSSGWYLCLFMRTRHAPIERVADGEVGIDPGFISLLSLSTGEKIDHPSELAASARRLAQAQRGGRKRQAARISERIGNQRKNRNHHLSRRLVAENSLICFSTDNVRGLARSFGKSVSSASHAQLRRQLRYKSLLGGTEFIEVPSRNSTRTCSACGSLDGPTGWRGLKVRQWVCACGATHDRDINAAVNTLIAGRGLRLKDGREAVSGIASHQHREGHYVTVREPGHGERTMLVVWP